MVLCFGFVCCKDCRAITIKKAAPVATQEASSGSTVNSLVPTVIGLIAGVKELSAKQKELTSNCIPSSQEIAFVNELVKEWAKTGSMSAEEVQARLGKRCDVVADGYKTSLMLSAITNEDNICYEYFTDEGMVWEFYPKATVATYCVDGSNSCSDKEKKTASNIYDIFNLIDFYDSDYTSAQEITMVGKLTAKVEECSDSKLNAKKRAMWGEFLTNTVSSMGQSTNTGSIMEQVQGITGGGGLGSSLSSFGSMASQLFNK